jgi:hypothetical protein
MNPGSNRAIVSLLVIFLVFFLFSSCATIINGGNQRIRVKTEPGGAEVYVNGKLKGITPCDISVKRRQKKSQYNKKNELNYVLKKEGYEESRFNSQRKISWSTYIDGFVNSPVGALFIVSTVNDPETIGGGLLIGIPLLVSLPLDLITGAINIYDRVVMTLLKPDLSLKPDKINAENKFKFQRISDVDNDIPPGPKEFPYRFALIIGNEDYFSYQPDQNPAINVTYARNDASAFRDYASTLLGIPEQNITFLLDATSGQMKQAIAKTNLIIKNSGGKAEVFVYYAGHGFPDETTRNPYLIPVDINGKNAADGISLQDFYSRLTQYPSKRVVVFMDACFSGGARNQGLIAARGIKIIPKENELSGNLIAFYASSGSQPSLPFSKQEHGLFTYYLLQNLKETRAGTTFGELSASLIRKISVQSILLNNSEQTPVTFVSKTIINDWSGWKINE